MIVIEEIHLIFSDIANNHNKFYHGWLHDDNTIIVEWGRIGASTKKNYGSKGKKFFDSLKKNKLKKGYTELAIVNNNSQPSTIVSSSKLHEIAKKQIVASDPLVEALIDCLVKANIHKITSETTITYNTSNGLFSTPLGIITQEAIDSARIILGNIKDKIAVNDFTSYGVISSVNAYLRLVPQKIKGKLDVKKIFPNNETISKQADILDALEASLKSVITTPLVPIANTDASVEEKIFSVKLSLATDTTVKKIQKLYEKTQHGYHQSSSLRVKTVYEVTIDSMQEAFKKYGEKIGNIMQLWHGTKDANLLSILKSGLKISPPSSTAITGKMFGQALYFSDQSTKALNYASGYWDGKRGNNNCFMLLCDVALGKSYTPKSSNEQLPKSGYDSTFAKAKESGVMNNEMMIYQEFQCNPLFLIEFEQ